MSEAQATNHNGRAAVLVIDNQTGFLGISAETMNNIGERIFGELLSQHYDEVVIVKAHDRNPKDNAVVKAMKREASKYGTVDMFVDMHTNMHDGLFAQVPINAFTFAFTENEKDHFRVLYNMGCGDGNSISAIEASYLGFKTFVGHSGTPSASPLFAYPFTVKWLEKGVTISEAANSTYSDMEKAAEAFEKGVVENWKIVQKGLEIVQECSKPQEGREKLSFLDIGTCVALKAANEVAVVKRILTDTLAIIPESKDFLKKYAVFMLGAASGSRMEKPEILMYSSQATAKNVEGYLSGKLKRTLNATKPFISGADIKFESEMPPAQHLDKKDAIKKLSDEFYALAKIDPKSSPNIYEGLCYSAHRASMLLGQFGATKEIEVIVDDQNLESAKRFIAVRALMEFDLKKYYQKFVDLIKVTSPSHQNDSFDVEARNQVIWFTDNSDILRQIEADANLPQILRREATVKLIKTGAIEFAELTKMVADKNNVLLVRRVAVDALMKSHYTEALPVLRIIYGDSTDDINIRSDIEFFIFNENKAADFQGVFEKIIEDVDARDEMRYGALGKLDSHAPSILKKICKHIIDTSSNRELVTAANLYLYDQKEINDEELQKKIGYPRSHFRYDWGVNSGLSFLQIPQNLKVFFK